MKILNVPNKIIGLLYIFCLYYSAMSQEPKISSGMASCETTIQRGKVGNGQTDLRQVDLRFGSISIPSDMERKDKKCYEGNCWEFTNNELVLSIDWNSAAWRPTSERQNSDFVEDYLLVDGVRTKMWSWTEGGTYKFVSGANYATEKKYRVGQRLFEPAVLGIA